MSNQGEDLQPGVVVDETYQIISLLGEGGMGKVYLCEHIILKNRYAMKALNLGENQVNWRRFQAEARAIAKLSHPNLVKVHNMGIYQKRVPYYVMDLLAGESLRQRILRDGPLSQAEAIRIFIAVCCGLEYAHQYQIIHRDIKPANIMLAGTEVKLVDFGLVKSVGDMVQKLTATGEILGSPYYMSPEQTVGDKLDYGCDLYSIGVSMFEALTGTVPFKGANAVQTLLMHQTAPAPALASGAPAGSQLSLELENIVAVLLAKDPRDRFRSAALLVDALDKLQNNLLPQSKSAILHRPSRLSWAAAEKKLVESGSDSAVTKKSNDRKTDFVAVGAFSFISLAIAIAGATTIWSNTGSKDGGSGHKNSATVQPNSEKVQAFFLETKNGRRIFKFPAKIAKGQFQLQTKGDMTEAQPIDGLLEVPSNASLLYAASTDLPDHAYLIKGFAANDLYALDLSKCGWQCARILQQCHHLTGLQKLNLTATDCDGQSLNVLNDMPRLNQLLLNQTTIKPSDVYNLPLFKQLLSLEFSYCGDTTDLLNHLIDHQHLRNLALESSPLTVEDCKKIARIPHLESLVVAGDSITAEKLKPLVKIKTLHLLDIRFNQITPDCLDLIATLPPKTTVKLSRQNWINSRGPRLLARQITLELSKPRASLAEQKSNNEEINQASRLITAD